jgi:hypothetical protein
MRRSITQVLGQAVHHSGSCARVLWLCQLCAIDGLGSWRWLPRAVQRAGNRWAPSDFEMAGGHFSGKQPADVVPGLTARYGERGWVGIEKGAEGGKFSRLLKHQYSSCETREHEGCLSSQAQHCRVA